MRSGWVLALVLMTACSESAGVIIRVHAPAGDGQQPTAVRLFLGMKEVFDHLPTPISPARTANALDASRFRANTEVWIREQATDILPIAAGEPAVFVFRPANGFTELGAVIAVGYLGGDDGTLPPPLWTAAAFHAELTFGDFTIYDLHLRPAVNPSDARANELAHDQLQLWGEDRTCVYFRTLGETADLDGGHQAALLIDSETDRDCDGLEDGFDDGVIRECVEDVHLGQRPPRNDDLSCVTSATGNPSFGACALGGPRCADGMPYDPTECTESRYCAPQLLCEACRDSMDQHACVRDVTSSSTLGLEVPTIECILRARWTTSDMLDLELCPATSSALSLIPQLIPAGLACKLAEIAGEDGSFDSSLRAESSVSGEDIEIKPKIDAQCQLTVSARGQIDNASDLLGPRTTLLTVDLATPGTRDLAVPIRFRVESETECPMDGAVECHLAPSINADPALHACLRLEPPAT